MGDIKMRVLVKFDFGGESKMTANRIRDNALCRRMEYVLDAVYHDRGISSRRVSSQCDGIRRSIQLGGTDVFIRGIGNTCFSEMLWVDEKCAVKYWNKSLDTFSFELASANNPDGLGWFLADTNTTHYMLVWPRCADSQLQYFLSLELMLVSKKDVQRLVRTVTGMDLKKLAETVSAALPRAYFDGDARVVRSLALPERPVNVVVPKALLRDIVVYHQVLSGREMGRILLSYRNVPLEEKLKACI